MGAVRVAVRLTNGADEALMRAGQLRPEDVRSYEGQALVDTGAMDNLIPAAVLRQLGLTAMERTPVRYADGRREVVDKIAPMMIYVLDRRANGSAFVLGDGILIGRLALASMDLHVDCMNQRVIPNPLHPDGPVFRI